MTLVRYSSGQCSTDQRHAAVAGGSLVEGVRLGAASFANGSNISGIALSGFNVDGGGYAGIEFVQTGGFRAANVAISGGVLAGGGAACIPLRITDVDSIAINGVLADATTVAALNIASATQVRITGGVLKSTGASSVTTAGVCTDGYLDKSVHFGGPSKMSNGATGFRVETHGNATPASGTWAVGDRVEQSVPVVGQPKGWRCTVAGPPGTWVSEGNL